MNKTSNKFKIFYYIWGILLAVLLGSYVFMELDTSVLVAAVIVLFGGAALFRNWKSSVVEIEIRDEAAYMEMLDGRKKAIKLIGIIQIRKTNNGTVLRFSDGEEVHTRNGKNKIIIRNGDNVTSEFRKEDFPYAEIINAKK
jgi:hypothetical protein